MKESAYNYKLKLAENRWVVLNTLNTTVLVLNDDELRQLSSISADIGESLLECYRRNGFVVKDTLDERSLVNFDRAYRAYHPKTAFYKILTTSICNARCEYCFEQQMAPAKMTIETADAVFGFIKNQEPADISINWFGGEPLLNHAIITYLSSKISEHADEIGASVSYSMVTNGSLFTDELIRRAVDDWLLERVQITLDGNKERYEAVRRFKDNSTFEAVICNIKKLLDAGIRVTIRLNVDVENRGDLFELIDYLEMELSGTELVNLYPYYIYNDSEEPSADIINAVFEVQKAIEEKFRCEGNKPTSLPKYKPSACQASSISSYVIAPNGDLFKCARFMDESNLIGNVSDSAIELNSSVTKWCDVVLNAACQNCVFLPICQGGCKADQMCGLSGCLLQKRTIDLLLRHYVD